MTDTANASNAPTLSPTERVIDTFIEPTKTFADIKRSRAWWLPFLLVVVFGYAYAFAAQRQIGFETIAANVLHGTPRSAERLSQQTPEQQAQTLSYTAAIIKYSFVATPLVVFGVNLIFALLLWAGFAFVLGGTTDYSEMLAVSMYASLPGIISSIAAIVVVFAADPQHYNINVPTPANLAYFLDMDAPGWLRALLGSIDLFRLWSLALMGAGGAIVARVKPARGLAMVFGAWALYVLVKTGFAAL